MLVSSHLKALQALELAIRTGSFKAAAERLAISPAAVGQRIKALEDWLGLDLVVRGRSGILPTRELQNAATHLAAAFRELDAVTTKLDFQRVQEIHVVADSDWAELWLRPRLPAFRATHPNILFCVNGTGDVPIRLGLADCEVWFGESRSHTAEDLLFRDYLVPVCALENAQRTQALPAAERLEGFPLLHLDYYRADPDSIGWPEWTRRHGYRKTAADRGIRYASVTHALEAVYSAAGFLICGLALVSEPLGEGRLSLAFPLSEGGWTSHAYRASFREGVARRSQIATFRAWLAEQGRRTEADLAALVRSAGIPAP